MGAVNAKVIGVRHGKVHDYVPTTNPDGSAGAAKPVDMVRVSIDLLVDPAHAGHLQLAEGKTYAVLFAPQPE